MRFHKQAMVQRRVQQWHVAWAGGNAGGGDDEQEWFFGGSERDEGGKDGGGGGAAEGIFGEEVDHADAGDDEVDWGAVEGEDGLNAGGVEYVSLNYGEVG